MKSPIFKEHERRNWVIPELEIFKLKFKREFDKSWWGKLNYKILSFLTK